MFAGHTTVGACVSLTVTVNEHEPVFDDASVVVQLTVVVPTGKVEPVAGTHTTVAPGQLSVPVGVVKFTIAEHCPAVAGVVMFAGHVTAGASVSFTVTVNEHVPVFVDASVAVHVTVVTPTGKVAPDAGTHTTVAPGQLSDAVGVVKFTTAEHWPAVFDCVMFAGHVTAGACVSCTVTVNEQLGPAVVVQLTVVVPTGKLDPEGGVHVTVPQLPVVVGAEYAAGALHCPAAAGTVTFAGHVMVQPHAVAHAGANVVMVISHPSASVPMSPDVSSTTKSCQLPFGAVPLKTERVEPYGPTGAGAANVSPAPMFVGRNVPDIIVVESGRFVAAASSNVIATLTMSRLPPVSEARMTDWPTGPISRMSTSSGNVCDQPTIRAVTFVTVPVKPETAIVEGYGLATPDVPEAGIEIDVPFANVVDVGAVPPRTKLNVTVPRFVAPSCSCRVAVSVAPHASPESAVKVNDRVIPGPLATTTP
jgi:hypothetical protein